jgi:hypothetical protein
VLGYILGDSFSRAHHVTAAAVNMTAFELGNFQLACMYSLSLVFSTKTNPEVCMLYAFEFVIFVAAVKTESSTKNANNPSLEDAQGLLKIFFLSGFGSHFEQHLHGVLILILNNFFSAF